MARITDQATLQTMKGRQIRFMGGTYGGERKKGSGCGWVDNTAMMSPKKMWVIVDMTGQGKQLKHTQVSHSSFRYSNWFNVQVLTFEEHLLQQYPEIEDSMEQLAMRGKSPFCGMDAFQSSRSTASAELPVLVTTTES
jgi:hypothetical protein